MCKLGNHVETKGLSQDRGYLLPRENPTRGHLDASPHRRFCLSISRTHPKSYKGKNDPSRRGDLFSQNFPFRHKSVDGMDKLDT